MLKLSKGFTIVELLIVIVVIAILATISIVAYNGVQDRAEYARARTDLKHINDALVIYKSQNAGYPTTSNAWTDVSASLTSIVPSYLDKIPPVVNKTGYSYKYRSDATDYKLLRVISGGLPGAESSNNELLNASGTYGGVSWGYWSSGAASW